MTKRKVQGSAGVTHCGSIPILDARPDKLEGVTTGRVTHVMPEGLPSNWDVGSSLRLKRHPCLSDGFVALVDWMGDDGAVVQAARVSYGAGTKTTSDDRTLIRYLMRHRHSTPFEMAELKFLVRVPMDCWRQWIRHRMASVNEYSTRYSQAIDSCDQTEPYFWRTQSTTNKQGSAEFLDPEIWPEGWAYDGATRTLTIPTGTSRKWSKYAAKEGKIPSGIGEHLTQREKEFQEMAFDLYKERLAAGVAREQARKDLPLSTYTEAYWKVDLHNLMHFLALRMDSHAQKEIRQYATIIGQDIVSQLFPTVWGAFRDYRLNAMNMTALDIAVVTRCNAGLSVLHAVEDVFGPIPDKKKLPREVSECLEKLKTLGLKKVKL